MLILGQSFLDSLSPPAAESSPYPLLVDSKPKLPGKLQKPNNSSSPPTRRTSPSLQESDGRVSDSQPMRAFKEPLAPRGKPPYDLVLPSIHCASRVPRPKGSLALARPRPLISLQPPTEALPTPTQTSPTPLTPKSPLKSSISPIAQLNNIWEYCKLPFTARMSGRPDHVPFSKRKYEISKPFLSTSFR